MEDEKVEVEVVNSLMDEKALIFDITEAFVKDIGFPVKRMSGPVDLMYNCATGVKSAMEASSRLFDTYDEMLRSVGRTDAIYTAYVHPTGKYRLRSGSIRGVKAIVDKSCFMCTGNSEAWEALSHADEVRAATENFNDPDFLTKQSADIDDAINKLPED